jgi:subtilisin family serine protease
MTVSAPSGPSTWFVELAEPAAAVAWAEALEEAPPSEAKSLGVLARARAAAGARLDSIAAAQAEVAPLLAGLGARELYRVRRALNGLAVLATPEQAAAFRRLPGVKAVRPIEPEVLHNRTSVPFIGAPALWQSATPIPAGLKGQGVRIGIIDTGIDYLHGGFGGTGVLADYQQAATDSADWTANPRSGPGRFPTAKIAGGWDFAGDSYSAGLGTPPAPDPNPMDCNGHGSHVAGTAAGFGVTAAGTTYTGAYNATDPYSTAPRIGPGVAPEAKLYALRVFGCGGSTALTAQAIDWAIDPDGDGDFSDRLDVINMSLGSSFGNPNDVSADASDNAARAGVIVVTSAGNSGDTIRLGQPRLGRARHRGGQHHRPRVGSVPPRQPPGVARRRLRRRDRRLRPLARRRCDHRRRRPDRRRNRPAHRRLPASRRLPGGRRRARRSRDLHVQDQDAQRPERGGDRGDHREQRRGRPAGARG